MDIHAPFDYSEVTPLIFIGQNACCVTHFDGTLTARGVRADISLEKEQIDQPYGVDFFLWLPTEDHTAMSHEKADLGILTLRYFAEKNIPCFVHCKNGHGRAPMLVAAYLIADHGKTAEEAVAYLRERRPVMHLQDVQMAFLKERGALRK
ncbi:MAG: dual specificity protein phosphatase family protein [Patescibacteria group bacterium]